VGVQRCACAWVCLCLRVVLQVDLVCTLHAMCVFVRVCQTMCCFYSGHVRVFMIVNLRGVHVHAVRVKSLVTSLCDRVECCITKKESKTESVCVLMREGEEASKLSTFG